MTGLQYFQGSNKSTRFMPFEFWTLLSNILIIPKQTTYFEEPIFSEQ